MSLNYKINTKSLLVYNSRHIHYLIEVSLARSKRRTREQRHGVSSRRDSPIELAVVVFVNFVKAHEHRFERGAREHGRGVGLEHVLERIVPRQWLVEDPARVRGHANVRLVLGARHGHVKLGNAQVLYITR